MQLQLPMLLALATSSTAWLVTSYPDLSCTKNAPVSLVGNEKEQEYDTCFNVDANHWGGAKIDFEDEPAGTVFNMHEDENCGGQRKFISKDDISYTPKYCWSIKLPSGEYVGVKSWNITARP